MLKCILISLCFKHQIIGINSIGGSQPMQNDQTYFFSDIFLNFYNIIKL